jgi:hypothetical protein
MKVEQYNGVDGAEIRAETVVGEVETIQGDGWILTCLVVPELH